MKKQLLAIAIVTMLLVATILGTVANAATTSSIAKEGNKVNVTLNADEGFTRGAIKVKFDTEHYDYSSVAFYDAEGKTVTVSGTLGNITDDGRVTFAPYGASAGITKVVITFTEKEGATGKEVFTITEFGQTGVASVDGKLEGSNLVLSEAEPPVDENNTTEGNTVSGGNTATEGNTATGGNTASKGNTTNTPTELANTGAPIYVVGIAAVVVAAFVLIVKNAKR